MFSSHNFPLEREGVACLAAGVLRNWPANLPLGHNFFDIIVPQMTATTHFSMRIPDRPGQMSF